MHVSNTKDVTLTVQENNGYISERRISVDKYMNTVFKNLGVYDKNLTEAQYNGITTTAMNNNNDEYLNTLERQDLDKNDIKKLAAAFGYDDFYEISFQGNNMIITIKENENYRNPSARTIKKDFLNSKSNVLLGKGQAHPNYDIFTERQPNEKFDARNVDYDDTVFLPGDKLVIPISEVVIQDEPSNYKANGWNKFCNNN